jgi:lysophospholipase L1-like esterase
MKVRICIPAIVLTGLILGTVARGQSFVLHNGDRVVFYGDSITAQRYYTKLTEEFVLTRYPGLDVRFFNAGVPGDTVYGGYAGSMSQRVQRDVAVFHPTMITVMLGMNDGGYGYTPPAKMHGDFQTGYTALLEALRAAAPSASLTLINPTPYDEVTHGTEFPGYADLVAQLSADVTKFSTEVKAPNGEPVYRADFQAPLLHALQVARQQDPQLAALLIPDRIHPAEVTHWIMAAVLMRAWHVDPMVSDVVLDSKGARVARSERATVQKVKRGGGGITWETLEQALPLPLDLNNVLTGVMLRVSDVATLDQEMLTVRGLEPGSYRLFIDEKPVGKWNDQELAHGVNLALVKTPMLDQARGLDWIEDRRMTLDQARFILGAEVKPDAGTPAAQVTLAKAEDELADEIRAKLTPKTHTFELRRQ